jgi:DNA-binding winged helix-turn-helix (wHTH) protein/tetratricopeptide (TPR) repeat protein
VTGAERIDLAQAAEFRLGQLVVRPPIRQLCHDDGRDEVLEPRVMQVLVALAHAEGGIVSRDMLTACCWEGRVVGEDAINRVISRLRRSAEGIGQGSFRIETITKVGYRLLTGEPAARHEATSPPSQAESDDHGGLSRRTLVAGALGAVAMAGGAVWLANRPRSDRTPSPEVQQLMTQALQALRQANAEGSRQANGLLRLVTERAPDYADGWGALAYTYAGASHGAPSPLNSDMAERTLATARRAFALDPHNGFAQAARAVLVSRTGNWTQAEALARAAIRDQPDNDFALFALATQLASVGRMGEAADLLDRAVALAPTSPLLLFMRVQDLWAAGRGEEADRAIRDAVELFPSHFAIWFTRCYLLLYTGRADAALGMVLNRTDRPSGIPSKSFDELVPVLNAAMTRHPAQIDTAIAVQMTAARRGAGYAENAMQFAAFLGRVDAAFEIAAAYYLGRGFRVPDVRFTPEQGGYTRMTDRRTSVLFLPSTAAMRRDPRFDALVTELGLTRYWADVGVQPDYRRT